MADEGAHGLGFLLEHSNGFRKLWIAGDLGVVVLLEEFEIADDDSERRAQVVAHSFDLPLKGTFACCVVLAFLLDLGEQLVEVVEQRCQFCIGQRQVKHLVLGEVAANEREFIAGGAQSMPQREVAVGEKAARKDGEGEQDGHEHSGPSRLS